MKLSNTQCLLQTYLPTIPSPVTQNQLSAMCYLASLLDQVKKEQDARSCAKTGKSIPGNNNLVLLADDDCDDRELFTDVVSEISAAIHVTTVENGLQLMSHLHETGAALPSVIFLDLNMPGKSSRECLVEIKNNPRFNDIPVVIYSTSVNKKDIQETHGIGANLYVPKPNSFKGLIAVITKVFSLDMEDLKITPPLNQFVLSAEVM